MDYKEKFYDITALIQQEFERNLKLYGNKMQCRMGCSKCCSQIFRITPLDGQIITEHVKSLPEREKETLIARAFEYNGMNKSHETGIPCPALGPEDECTIYDARPIVCRRFGMPIFDYKNPDNVYACELNFNEGEKINDPLLIPNQTKIGKKWDYVKSEFGEGSTTIAEAISKAANH